MFFNGDLKEVFMDALVVFSGKLWNQSMQLEEVFIWSKAVFENMVRKIYKVGQKSRLESRTNGSDNVHEVYWRRITNLNVYVDEIILIRSDEFEITRLKKFLATEFEIKGLGSLQYFLGMEVARSKKRIIVTKKVC